MNLLFLMCLLVAGDGFDVVCTTSPCLASLEDQALMHHDGHEKEYEGLQDRFLYSESMLVNGI